jgi:Bax protein
MKKRYLPIIIILTAVIVYFAVMRIYVRKGRIEPIRVEISSVDQVIPIESGMVPPVIYGPVPDLRELKTTDRKKTFVNILLPSILLVKEQILNDRTLINELISKGKVNDYDTSFVNLQLKTYKVESINELPDHMVMPPVSIVLAQAAIESGWGTSRFFREGNNVFGMWSYSKSHDRMKAGKSREGSQIYVRVFPDIYTSVLNYSRTIGRLRVYKEFRHAINTENDPYILVDHLRKYSERRESYTQTIKKVMKKNNFTKYDSYKLLSDWAFEEILAEKQEVVYD